MDIKTADLVFVKGTGVISRIIEGVERSPYSHVAGVVKPNELFESQAFRDAGYQGEDAYDGHADVFTCDELTDDQRQKIVTFAVDKLGTGYDYPLIGWELFHYECHIDLPYDEDGRVDCSQLWREAYQSVGIELCPRVEFASPGDLAKSTLLRKVGALS